MVISETSRAAASSLIDAPPVECRESRIWTILSCRFLEGMG